MKSTIFLNRAKRLQQQLKKWGIDGCIIENPIDLFYLTGLNLSAGLLMIETKGSKLYVDGRYLAYAEKAAPFAALPLSKIDFGKHVLGFDAHSTTVQRWNKLQKLCGKLIPIDQPLKEIRAVKEKSELKALEKSCRLLWKGYEEIRRKIRAGMTEQEVALLFEVFCRKAGAEKLSFDPIIAFGKNSAYPHHRASKTKLKRGDIVLCDIGVVVDHYHSDMTRMFFFGKPDPRLVVIESVVKKAHGAALKLCKPGVKVGELDAKASAVIREAGLEEFLAHSLGHGIGLETHEFPRIKAEGADGHTVLQEGMVITIEPGLYLPGVGGVRHEDMVVITAKGYQNLYD